METSRVDYLLYYSWLGLTPVIAGATIWWIQARLKAFAECSKSVVLSGLAIVPGTLFWIEYTVRNAPAWFGTGTRVAGYDCPSLLFACVGVPAIPLLLLASALSRPRSGVPRSMNVLQAAHLAGCLLSGNAAVMAAAAV